MSVFAFADIDLGLVVVVTVWLVDSNVYLGVVVTAVVWKEIGEMRTMFGDKVREVRSVKVWELDVDVSC